MKNLFLSLLVLGATQSLYAGDGVGNIETSKNNKAALQQLLENNGLYLKRSMINYLDTLQVDQIQVQTPTEQAAKNFFSRVDKEVLKADIVKSSYVDDAGCFDQHSNSTKGIIAARAGFGDKGGTICFNLDKFYQQYRSVSHEERTLQLVSIAFHEHVHHFQVDGRAAIAANEAQAYEVSAYVLNTAVYGSMPTIEWSATGGKEYFQLVTCNVTKGPEIGLTISDKAFNVLTERKFKGMASTVGGNEVFSNSFSVEFVSLNGTLPTLLVTGWPIGERTAIPVMVADPTNDKAMPISTQLLQPQYEFIGKVTRRKFRGEYVVKNAQFSIKSKAATYVADFQGAAQVAVNAGVSVDAAVQAESAKYSAGLVDSEMTCTVEGLVR